MDISPINAVGHVATSQVSPPTEDQQAMNRQIVTAVKALNQAEFLGENNELSFQLDRGTQRVVIQIVDRKTKEVLRQIPPEYVLRVAADLRRD